jgi:hypothetical protein
LKSPKTPVKKLVARHRGVGASKATEEQEDSLSAEIFLAIGARVILRKNLWVARGLVNGSVKDLVWPDIVILYRQNSNINRLFAAYLVVPSISCTYSFPTDWAVSRLYDSTPNQPPQSLIDKLEGRTAAATANRAARKQPMPSTGLGSAPIFINNNYDRRLTTPRRPTTPTAAAKLMASPESPIIAMPMMERTLFEYGVSASRPAWVTSWRR